MIPIDPKLEQYLDEHISPYSELLHDLLVETYQVTTQPHMISGHYQGRLLSLISKIIQPKLIVEIGTFTGYSTLCLAEGLQADGKIITFDINDELEYLGRKYFDQSHFAHQIDYRIGSALLGLETIENESVDLIFIDADKQSYPTYYQQAVALLRKGGLILIDNVLWYGKVLDEQINDLKTSSLRELNRMVTQDSRVDSVILPIRDGITLIRKK
ncbi:O-methyltransferase [Vaginella massiliensis]|uniref:O-methyltransferase n=1 Tax=Vaginella massiliensis TaxID=1816680 RepID=UPI000838A4E4|nr:class I SAM-dependent methyltransferase [Vaginella massiliensis]